jgi:hypothetical protein
MTFAGLVRKHGRYWTGNFKRHFRGMPHGRNFYMRSDAHYALLTYLPRSLRRNRTRE